jgi:hypothetical protein
MCEKYGHYLRGTTFECNTDHQSLEKLQKQETLSGRQARWILLLQEFDVKIKYVPGTDGTILIADFMTRNPTVQHQCNTCQKKIKSPKINQIITTDTTTDKESITENLESSPKKRSNEHMVNNFNQQVKSDYRKNTLVSLLDKKTDLSASDSRTKKQFTNSNGLWFFNNRLYIAGKKMQCQILERYHDNILAGHQSKTRTIGKIRRYYYWPGLDNDVNEYIKSCDTCQRHSTPTQKPQSYLHPLPVPDERFEDIGIDFAFLPKTKHGNDMVMVIVDRLTKLVMAIPCKKTDGAEEIAKLLVRHWITNGYGIPKVITSDRDTKFTSKVWQGIMDDLNIKQRMGTARHQQTNGQAENAIKTIKRTARKYAEYAHDTWDEWLHMITFALNDSESAATGFTPFYLALGYHPRITPNSEQMSHKQSCLVTLIQHNLELAKAEIHKKQQEQCKYYNRRRREEEKYTVGCQVMLQSEGIIWEPYKQRPTTALPSFLGPYRVLDIDRKDKGTNLTLELPESMARIHPNFSANYCKLYHSPKESFPDRTEKNIQPEPDMVIDSEGQIRAFYKIDKILDHRIHYRRFQLLVRYKGYHDDEAEWTDYADTDQTWDNANDRAIALAYIQRNDIPSTDKDRKRMNNGNNSKSLRNFGTGDGKIVRVKSLISNVTRNNSNKPTLF